MIRPRAFSLFVCSALVLAGCSGDGTGPSDPPGLACTDEDVLALDAGEHAIVDPVVDGACVAVPAAPAAGTEYLYLALATAGQESPSGVQAPYELEGTGAPLAAEAPLRPRGPLAAFRGPATARNFHANLRAQERALARSPGAAFDLGRLNASTAPTPPEVGHQRSFWVCATTTCSSFVQTTATARTVGSRVAIYLDDAAPAGGYTQADLDRVGTLFDNHLYPIDTTAFGRESDIDDNGVVVVLLTQRVNQLTPNCSSTGSVILGYFYGLDLLPGFEHSNGGEVFYSLVPDPDNADCRITESFANSYLPPVFVHEFQHMISFNQKVLVRGGSTEDTWLNEGLSHFAEELAGRQVPDAECPEFASCEDQFIAPNIDNAYTYLDAVEEHFLITPGNSTGTLAERGANWLFVRWAADHFATDQPLGTDLTRELVATARVGAANVETATGADFGTLVSQWQMANYLDNLPGFTPENPRLQYTSWNFRAVYAANYPGVFEKPYPLTPDSAVGGNYSRSGVLRAGSGRHVLVIQPPSGPSVEFVLTDAQDRVPPATIRPRVGLVRIR